MYLIIRVQCSHTPHLNQKFKKRIIFAQSNITTIMINFIEFPAVTDSDEDGLLAAGGDLNVDTLVSAYAQGIFPWFNDDQPILWWSPDPRLVLYPQDIKVSRSLRKLIQKNTFEVRCNTDFSSVIKACALRTMSPIKEETWITESMDQAYNALHSEGFAHSIEVWQDNKLVGGLYGIALGDVFFGESMFSSVSNASKVALVALCKHLERKNVTVIDCQVASEHLFSMGAIEISRQQFLSHLSNIDIQANSSNNSLAQTNFSLGIEDALHITNQKS